MKTASLLWSPPTYRISDDCGCFTLLAGWTSYTPQRRRKKS